MSDRENRWDGPAAMRTCSTAADFRSIAFELSNDSDPNTAAHWALPHHPRPGAGPDSGGVSAALGRLNQTGPTVMSKESIRNHLERHQGSSEESMHEVDPTKRTVNLDGRTIQLSSWIEACDEARERHALKPTYSFTVDEISNESRGPKGGFHVKGHAAVFNRTSLDLGGFREQIAPGFFQLVLDREPDVHAVWDHDTRLTLARTRNKTLELREDDLGLYNFIKVAPTSYAQDLRVLMERGDIDQQSFAFSVEEDRFEEDGAGNVMRTLIRASDLYDVTITAQGAYPQTSADVTRSIRSLIDLDRKIFAVPKVGDGAADSATADEATAVGPPADGAARERQAVSAEATEEFMRWKEARIKKAAAHASTLAKLAERLEKLE